MGQVVRRAWWWARRRWRAAAALCACLCACAVPLRVEQHTAARFPHHSPSALAHLLADFSNHPRLHPHIGSWSVEEERSNYTWWRYSVAYECGPRCTGRATLTASHHPPPGAGVDATNTVHRVHVAHSYCTSLPLLPWPSSCGSSETVAVVRGMQAGGGDGGDGEGGAQVEETARVWCAAVRALSGRCGHALRQHRDLHLQRLRDLLLD